MTDKPLSIRIVDVVRDSQGVVDQIIRNASIVVANLNPEKHRTNTNPRYEVVGMEVAAPPGGDPMARYAVAANGVIVVEGPTYNHARDAFTWLLAETMRMVLKEAPRAGGGHGEATSGPNARRAREE